MTIIDSIKRMLQDASDLKSLLWDLRVPPDDVPAKPERPLYVPTVLPEGLPPVYGTVPTDSGHHVVTVNGVATMAPRWPTYEEARRDAWERHWADERGEAALLAYQKAASDV